MLSFQSLLWTNIFIRSQGPISQTGAPGNCQLCPPCCNTLTHINQFYWLGGPTPSYTGEYTTQAACPILHINTQTISTHREVRKRTKTTESVVKLHDLHVKQLRVPQHFGLRLNLHHRDILWAVIPVFDFLHDHFSIFKLSLKPVPHKSLKPWTDFDSFLYGIFQVHSDIPIISN